MPKPATQRDLTFDLLEERGIVRLREFKEADITVATVSRMCGDGGVWGWRCCPPRARALPTIRCANHSLAEAVKRQPKEVACLVSALAFHGPTDRLPRMV